MGYINNVRAHIKAKNNIALVVFISAYVIDLLMSTPAIAIKY